MVHSACASLGNAEDQRSRCSGTSGHGSRSAKSSPDVQNRPPGGGLKRAPTQLSSQTKPYRLIRRGTDGGAAAVRTALPQNDPGLVPLSSHLTRTQPIAGCRVAKAGGCVHGEQHETCSTRAAVRQLPPCQAGHGTALAGTWRTFRPIGFRLAAESLRIGTQAMFRQWPGTSDRPRL